MTTEWTPEMVEMLLEMLTPSNSTQQIANAMNNKFGTQLTRNAIIGKTKRLGTSSKFTRVAPSVRKKTQQRTEKRKELKTFWQNKAKALPKKTGDLTILFVDRDMLEQCAWPLWNDTTPVTARRCCGKPIAAYSWCQEHLDIATVGVPKRRAV